MLVTMGMTPAPQDWYRAINPPRVERPTFETDSLPLIDAKLHDLALEFHRTGLVVFDPEIADFNRLAAEIRALDYNHPEKRLTNHWCHSEAVRKLACAPKILTTLEALYGRKPIPYQTLNFDVGTQQRTHSDLIHFSSIPNKYMCGVWIALEDTDEGNGPLFYYPGSHRLPIITPEEIGIDKTHRTLEERYAIYEDYVEKFVEMHGLKRQKALVKKGQAILWAANLFHGGSPILRPGSTRYSQVTHYFFEHCQYYAPIQSTVFLGRIQYIHFRNILTGERARQKKASWLNTFRLTSRDRVYRVLNRLSRLTGLPQPMRT